MAREKATIAKIARPMITEVLLRERLFHLMDGSLKKPIIWISSPAGSGKTTLIASYLDARSLSCLWYQLDQGDNDPASFFYYMGLAAKQAAPRYRTSLPLLTPEYLMGLPVFTKRYFEKVFSRLIPPAFHNLPFVKAEKREVKGRTSGLSPKRGKAEFVLVFDNYQDVPADSGFHEVIREALSVIPDGIRVIVLSRNEQPPALARFLASDKMSAIGWKDIKFTLEETKKLIGNRAKKNISDAVVKRLHDATDGWASGLVLIMDRAEAGEDYARPDGELTHEKVFDYFAEEVFGRLDSETRDFLLMASFLPRMTPETTAKLTENDQAGRILSSLRRNHFFTEQHAGVEAVYQFHPLFRSFLLTRVKESLSREGVLRVQKRAAALLVETGLIEDAVALFLETAEWESAIGLILGHAQALVMQGRNKTLEAWLNGIPREIVDAAPWLLFWKGACRLSFDPADSRTYYERSFALFKAGNDPAGSFLSCAGVMNTYFFEWDTFAPFSQWIKECGDLLGLYGDFPNKEIETHVTFSMFTAIFINQPDHPGLASWEKRARAIMQTFPDNNARVMIGGQLVWYYSMVSRISDAGSIFNEVLLLTRLPEITPMNLIAWYSMEAVYGWVTASFGICREAVRKGLEISDATGVVIMKNKLFAQAIYHSTITGDCKASSDYLNKLASTTDFTKRTDAGHYYYLASLDAFCRDDIASALEAARKSVDLTMEQGMPFSEILCEFSLAQALFHNGDHASAELHLKKVRAITGKTGFVTLEYACLLMEALFLLRSPDGQSEKRGLETLLAAMSFGSEHNNMNISMWRRSNIAWLCAKAMEAGIEREYVQELIRKHKLTPPDISSEFNNLKLENWPWPAKIYTLGRFELEVDGKTLSLSRTQQKPLLMLKALIAFGGEEVSEDRLTDALWPEAEGDAARKSFDTTLHRLRKFFGNEKAIRILKGRLTLDPGYFWTDTLTFERLTKEAASLWDEDASKKSSAAAGLYEKAAALYRGQFLPSDTRESWAAPARERARTRFITAVTRLSKHYQAEKNYDKAIEFLQEGLAIEGLSEELYQGLMTCYRESGRNSEAVELYHRLLKVLADTLGVEPSAKTEEIYLSLQRNS